ncbi:hypothetical protein IE53DRAFT_377886 [Violaceomyces palustris]|uniref:Uncharacterized protein n=1 Tax=Violaceomyces palustris TaxID=1673888 RepID=A0ACD0P429_9BASI|nr:hypothetical protein IE53DRAFT_377886 [Violaceomyces palustris]
MAEKFSRFRDAGTGIQVFLTPVPPASGTSALTLALSPISFVLGAVRVILISFLALIWSLFSLGSTVGRLNSIFARAILFMIGFVWINVEHVSLRSRGRAASSAKTPFAPGPGDLVLSNWSSWIDLLWLSTKFSPIFALPVVAPSARSTGTSTPGTESPARRKNVNKGSAAYLPSSASQSTEETHRLLGFRKASFLEVIRITGEAPLLDDGRNDYQSLDKICATSHSPVVVFPELVTSNNRGLLRFATIFPEAWRNLYRSTGALRMPKGQPKIFVLSFKHEPPTALLPTTVHSVPSGKSSSDTGLNPAPHLWSLVNTLPASRGMTVRLLDPAESVTGPTYLSDPQLATNLKIEDPVAEACAGLVSGLSRLRRTNLGWEDKEAFLDMVRRRR